MYKKLKLIIFLFLILNLVMGCSQKNVKEDILDFNVSYLDIQDNKMIVNNDVKIKVEASEADKVELYIAEQGESKEDSIIAGEKTGSEWQLKYSNNDPFIKEIWVVGYFDGERIISDKKLITNQSQSYEDAFENIVAITSGEDDLISMEKHESKLNVIGWVDENKILAKENEELIIYDIRQKEKESVHNNVWNVSISPNRKEVVFQDKQEIYVSQWNIKNKKKIFELNKDQYIKNISWSSKQDKILIHMVENKKDVFNSINIKTNNKKSLNAINNLEDYILDEIIYFDNNYLYAAATKKIKEDKELDLEISKELVYININTGKIRSLTPNTHTQDEVEVLGQVNKNEFLVKLTTKVISEEENNISNRIYLLNTWSKKMKNINKEIVFPFVFQYSPNKDNYIYIRKEEDDNTDSDNEKIIVLGDKYGNEKNILKMLQYYPNEFYWSPNGSKIMFYINNTHELYIIEKLEND